MVSVTDADGWESESASSTATVNGVKDAADLQARTTEPVEEHVDEPPVVTEEAVALPDAAAGDEKPPVVAAGTDDKKAPPKRGTAEHGEDRVRTLRRDIASATNELRTLEATRDATKGELASSRAELDALRRELVTLRSGQPAAEKPAVVDQPTADDPKPLWADYDAKGKPYDDFVADLGRWGARQETRALQTKFDAEQKDRDAKAKTATETADRDRANTERGTRHQARLADARTKIPDFDTRVDPDFPISPSMQNVIIDAQDGPGIMVALCEGRIDPTVETHLWQPLWEKIVSSPIGAQLLEHLSATPADAVRLRSLNPLQGISELTKIEARLEAANSGSAPARPVSKAKAPGQPVVGSGKQPSGVDFQAHSDDDFGPGWAARELKREQDAQRSRGY